MSAYETVGCDLITYTTQIIVAGKRPFREMVEVFKNGIGLRDGRLTKVIKCPANN